MNQPNLTRVFRSMCPTGPMVLQCWHSTSGWNTNLLQIYLEIWMYNENRQYSHYGENIPNMNSSSLMLWKSFPTLIWCLHWGYILNCSLPGHKDLVQRTVQTFIFHWTIFTTKSIQYGKPELISQTYPMVLAHVVSFQTLFVTATHPWPAAFVGSPAPQFV